MPKKWVVDFARAPQKVCEILHHFEILNFPRKLNPMQIPPPVGSHPDQRVNALLGASSICSMAIDNRFCLPGPLLLDRLLRLLSAVW